MTRNAPSWTPGEGRVKDDKPKTSSSQLPSPELTPTQGMTPTSAQAWPLPKDKLGGPSAVSPASTAISSLCLDEDTQALSVPTKKPGPPMDAPNASPATTISTLDLDDNDNDESRPWSDLTLAEDPVVVEAAKTRSRSSTKTSNDGKRRLSASKIQELMAAPESLPVATISDEHDIELPLTASLVESGNRLSIAERLKPAHMGISAKLELAQQHSASEAESATGLEISRDFHGRPSLSTRTVSSPPINRRKSTSQPPARGASTRRNSFQPLPRPAPLDLNGQSNFPTGALKKPASTRKEEGDVRPPSPIPPSIPLPPMWIGTHLQLELAAQRPSPLYIHHSHASDATYESSAIKFERLKNFLLLPFYVERTIVFGALACLDAWLWTFTILPIRSLMALWVLVQWWAYLAGKEARWLVGFVWYGLGRMWRRGRRGRSVSTGSSQGGRTDASRSRSGIRDPGTGPTTAEADSAPHRLENLRVPPRTSRPHKGRSGHRRTKSIPSGLTSMHKADMLQGCILLCSSIALMNLDASRMYHFIRAQSAIKLYAIYNLLEVGDRLLSALGQDIFECLFSTETLSRNSSGRSKVMLPLGMLLLALVYNILHSVVLFYQVIALNVAVNSYSNALLTLLLSNQFVEIKSAVFKRFEKENNFQLACADIVERFQLLIMLFIIGMRNVVEVGGFTVPGAGNEDAGLASIPLHTPSILPASFTILPAWMRSGEVLSPFIVVIGSEMIVDWVKHAYINKFNNIKPAFYSRILDILCKDYYTNAFGTPSLTRRLGLPVLPLSCLFLRASVQIYNMFLATHVAPPNPPSVQTAVSVDSIAPSPAMLVHLDRLDSIIRNALGRAVYGYPDSSPEATVPPGNATKLWLRWTSDDVIAAGHMVIVFFLIFAVLVIVKLLLGMLLLRYSRDRYARMKQHEHAIATGQAEKVPYDAKGKRVGGYGQVEVGEDRRRWIFADDPEGLKKVREREKKTEKGAEKEKDKDFGHIMRYDMVSRRIW